MSEPAAAGCPSCGAAVSGRFCAACGEQKVTERDYSVAHYIGHVFESLASFDFKSLRSVTTLLVRPGRLTRDYLDGRRRAYIGPVQLFVIVNVVYALAAPLTFRTPLSVQETDGPFVQTKRAMVASAIAQRHVEREEFQRSFDEAAGLHAKTWVFAMIPLLALATALLYGLRRYFFEHLIFATHFLAFTLTWGFIDSLIWSALVRFAGVADIAKDRDTVTSWILLAGLGIYLFVSLRRTFGDGRVSAAARAFGMTVLFFPIVLAYRFLLFFVTLWSMH